MLFVGKCARELSDFVISVTCMLYDTGVLFGESFPIAVAVEHNCPLLSMRSLRRSTPAYANDIRLLTMNPGRRENQLHKTYLFNQNYHGTVTMSAMNTLLSVSYTIDMRASTPSDYTKGERMCHPITLHCKFVPSAIFLSRPKKFRLQRRSHSLSNCCFPEEH